MVDSLKEDAEKLAKILRSKYLDNTKNVAKRIQKKYQSINGDLKIIDIYNDFSKHIAKLVELEKNEFNIIIKEVEENWLKEYISQEIKLVQIEDIVFKLTKLDKDKYSNLELFYEFNKSTSELMNYIIYSNKQSSKSRAGSCFEHHLSFLFDILKMQYDDQVTLGTSSEKFDFIFPNEDFVKTAPSSCMLVEAQTTINDRFRLTTGKGDAVKGAQRFLMTLTGLGIISKRDINFLTHSKIDELRDKRVSLVVHQDVKKKLQRQDVYSFEDFCNTIYVGKKDLWLL